MRRDVIVPFFIVHQGCPHRCVFCNQSKISGCSEAVPESAELLDKIELYRQMAGTPAVEVAFFGGTFTALPLPLQERLLNPLQRLLAKEVVSGVRLSTRPDAINEEIALFLRQRGVKTVELGVQSLDDEVLRRSGRGHGSREVSEACNILREHGFQVGIQLMTGLPGDSPDRCLASLGRALRLRPDFLRIYPTLVLAATELELLFRKGVYAPQSLQEAVELCKVMLTTALRAKVPVIRIGLQPSQELEAHGAIVAGPYHPAFRQLVEGELWYDALAAMTSEMTGPITVWCPPARISDVAGQRRGNISRLFSERGITIDAIRPDPLLSPLELKVGAGNRRRTGNIMQGTYTLTEVP